MLILFSIAEVVNETMQSAKSDIGDGSAMDFSICLHQP